MVFFAGGRGWGVLVKGARMPGGKGGDGDWMGIYGDREVEMDMEMGVGVVMYGDGEGMGKGTGTVECLYLEGLL